jgi:hypothetical protein
LVIVNSAAIKHQCASSLLYPDLHFFRYMHRSYYHWTVLFLDF